MKRKGFAAVVIILIVMIVLAVAGGIWYYYAAHRSLMVKFASTNNNSPSASPVANNVVTSYTTKTVGTTTIVTITDPAFENAGWIPASDTTTTLIASGTIYSFKKLFSPCINQEGVGIVCDESLLATTNETTTVLIPSVLSAIGLDSSTIPSLIYSIGITNSQFFFGANNTTYKGSYSIGEYSLNLSTRKVSKLSYTPGDCETGGGTSDAYILDYYNGSTTPIDNGNKDEILTTNVKIFSLVDNAVIYNQALTAPQGIDNGGMGCQAFYGKLNSSSTFYDIRNQLDGTLISTVQVNLP